MRLHSDIITHTDIFNATKGLKGVYATYLDLGSRSRNRAFEVRLEGNGYARNTGRRRATWDEWGVVIARLFAIDPDAFWGSAKYPTYIDAAHFHEITGHRFFPLTLPDDTHKRHAWDWEHGSATCKKCSAVYSPAA